MADAKADDIKDLLGGALFKALYKWMIEAGPVYLLPTGWQFPLFAVVKILHVYLARQQQDIAISALAPSAFDDAYCRHWGSISKLWLANTI